MITATTCNSISIYTTLFKLFEKAISTAYPDVSNPPIIVTYNNNQKFGDYQCTSALPLYKQLNDNGENQF